MMRHGRRILISLAALLITTPLAAAALDGGEATREEAVHVELAKQLELDEIARQLTDPEAGPPDGAIHRLIHLASTYPALPPRVRDLLIRATGVANDRLADRAQEALYLFGDRDRHGALVPEVAEEISIALAQRRDLERARQAIADSSSDPSGRLGAVRTLVHLASSSPALAEEILDLFEELRSDPHPTTSRLVHRTLANHRGRAVDPALVPLPGPSRQPADSGFADGADPFAELHAEAPGTRLAALELILDWALSESRRDDPKVIDALVRLRADSDPRVAHRARNALLGLAGDDASLGDVYRDRSGSDPPAREPAPRCREDPGCSSP